MYEQDFTNTFEGCFAVEFQALYAGTLKGELDSFERQEQTTSQWSWQCQLEDTIAAFQVVYAEFI